MNTNNIDMIAVTESYLRELSPLYIISRTVTIVIFLMYCTPRVIYLAESIGLFAVAVDHFRQYYQTVASATSEQLTQHLVQGLISGAMSVLYLFKVIDS